jgi:S1-C subfamily serine protease
MDGTVVGVNRARGGDNVGFAISAHVVREVVPELIQRGAFDHAFVGIRSVPVTPQVATANGLDRATGIAVVEVLSGGPADGRLRAGRIEDGTLTGGDVIVAVDGTPVRTHEDLSRFLLLHADPGEQVTFTVVRDGTRREVAVRLGERPPTG